MHHAKLKVGLGWVQKLSGQLFGLVFGGREWTTPPSIDKQQLSKVEWPLGGGASMAAADAGARVEFVAFHDLCVFFPFFKPKKQGTGHGEYSTSILLRNDAFWTEICFFFWDGWGS